MSFAVPSNKKKSKILKKDSSIVIELSFDKETALYRLDFAGKKAPGQQSNKALVDISYIVTSQKVKIAEPK